MRRPAATSPVGLSTAEAARRRARSGPNSMPQAALPHPGRELLRQMTHLFAGLLWVAAGLAVLAGMASLAAAIVVVVLVNGCFAFWQEHRADRAVQRLRALVPARARVRRDGVVVTVPVEDLVVGDLVVLVSGDRVPADCRVVAAHELQVDESVLTGESAAVHPPEGARLLAGTFLTQGETEARVEATGAATGLARIARLTQTVVRRPSPLAQELHRLVRVVSVTAVAVGAALSAGAVLLGLPPAEAFVFGLGVMVALVPEGLLPTVTLSLARAGQRMADSNALVRRLDAVETLGATTFICTDKTGTITRNEMSVVSVWLPTGTLDLSSSGYDPTATLPDGELRGPAGEVAWAAASCGRGRAVRRSGGRWCPEGDPMEAALFVAAHRLGRPPPDEVLRRLPYTASRRRSSVVLRDGDAPRLLTLGAPESVLARCGVERVTTQARAHLDVLAARGLRVLAVAAAPDPPGWCTREADDLEHGLRLLGLLALEDPPREGVGDAVRDCHRAGIRLAMVTGDHPATAAAVARETGLLGAGGVVLCGDALPDTDAALVAMLDHPEGAVLARVSPEDKLRIAVALRNAGHVVAMTGDGVNDGPALHAADVGVAMGASGSDVAREAADLVLLDDHFATIVRAVQLGRATYANIRRFLTFHLTDNVAELTPFAVWALSAGNVPLAIGVLQVLALDIGTDMLPALALGAEPPNERTLQGPLRRRHLVDRALLARAFGVLGPTEAAGAMATFAAVLLLGGWTWSGPLDGALLASASGSAFAAIALGQLANAVACRSTTRPAWRTGLRGNRLLAGALLTELVLLAVFLAPPVGGVLGGAWPGPVGWAGAACTGLLVLLVDATAKRAVTVGRRPATSSTPTAPVG